METTNTPTQKKFVVVMIESSAEMSVHRFGCADTKKHGHSKLGTGKTIKSAVFNALSDFCAEYENEEAFFADYLGENGWVKVQACAHAHEKAGA